MMFPEFLSFAKISVISCSLAVSATAGVSTAFAEADKFKETENALTVVLDRAKVVRIAKPADTIIIGNPSVVDATIQDARTLVLTGRNFGITNLIVLDSDGDAIVDETIVVKGVETNIVRIYRQDDRETLTCSPVCEGTLTLGDDEKNFARVNSQINARTSLAEANANDVSR